MYVIYNQMVYNAGIMLQCIATTCRLLQNAYRNTLLTKQNLDKKVMLFWWSVVDSWCETFVMKHSWPFVIEWNALTPSVTEYV